MSRPPPRGWADMAARTKQLNPAQQQSQPNKQRASRPQSQPHPSAQPQPPSHQARPAANNQKGPPANNNDDDMGAWTTKLSHRHSQQSQGARNTDQTSRNTQTAQPRNGASSSNRKGKSELKYQAAGPPQKKVKSKHDNNPQNNSKNHPVANSSGANKNKHIMGKKPKLTSLSMGDLVPNIKQVLPKGPKQQPKKKEIAVKQPPRVQQQHSQAAPSGLSGDFPPLPSSSQWPSLASAAPPNRAVSPLKPSTTTASKHGPPKNQPQKSTQNNQQSTGNGQQQKCKKQQQSQASPSAGASNKKGGPNTKKGKNANVSNKGNHVAGSNSFVRGDANHLGAQLTFPRGHGGGMDQNHLQGQFLVGSHNDGSGHDLMRLMQEGLVVQKKGRQRIKPRKKRFTALKKKILLERLRVWKETTSSNDKGNEDQGDKTTNASCTICLFGFASVDEVEDDDEFQETIDNLKEMAEKIGQVGNLYIPRDAQDVSGPDSQTESGRHSSFVQFVSSEDAAAAKGCWEGLVIGGQTLETEFLIAPSTTDGDAFEPTEEENWKQFCLSAKRSQRNSSSISSTSADVEMQDVFTGNVSIVLENVLTDDDIEDDDCLQESVQDIRAMVARFGQVTEVQAQAHQSDRDVVVTYAGGMDVAKQAIEALQKLKMGGSLLSARMLAVDSQKGDVKSSLPMILLENMLEQDEMEDEDCLNECLSDVRRLAEKHGSVTNIMATSEGHVRISYEGQSVQALQLAVTSLNSVCVGGQTLSAKLILQAGEENQPAPTNSVLLGNLLTEEDVEDEDCLEESLFDVRELAAQHGTVTKVEVIKNDDDKSGVVQINYEFTKDAMAAASAFDGMIIGGETVSASLKVGAAVAATSSTGEPEPTPVERKDQDEQPKEMFSGDKRIPERFAECKRAPKVPNTGTPRHYAVLTNDEQVKPLLVEMLNELTRLQVRALQDKNAKARRRIVIGLREVARGIRANKVKLVVMANNLDEYGAIDDKLQEILDLSAEKEVPILFELSKRVLGKAVGKKIKVSVVGIQNAEGAFQEFKKLCVLAPKHEL